MGTKKTFKTEGLVNIPKKINLAKFGITLLLLIALLLLAHTILKISNNWPLILSVTFASAGIICIVLHFKKTSKH